jgi:hypothetical protein
MRAIFSKLFTNIWSIVRLSCEACLWHNTQAGACDVQMLTALLCRTHRAHICASAEAELCGQFQTFYLRTFDLSYSKM